MSRADNTPDQDAAVLSPRSRQRERNRRRHRGRRHHARSRAHRRDRLAGMTMRFTAEDRAIISGVSLGEGVIFELKSADEPRTVTMVQRE